MPQVFNSFLFPWATMLNPLNFDSISIQDRIDLLEISLKCLSYFPNKNFYSRNMFHSQLLTDTRGTLISLLHFFFTHSEKVLINCLSSSPLEHNFNHVF